MNIIPLKIRPQTYIFIGLFAIWLINGVISIVSLMSLNVNVYANELAIMGFDQRFFANKNNSDYIDIFWYTVLWIPRVVFVSSIIYLINNAPIDGKINFLMNGWGLYFLCFLAASLIFRYVGYFPLALCFFVISALSIGVGGGGVIGVVVMAIIGYFMDMGRGVVMLGAVSVLLGMRSLNFRNVISQVLVIGLLFLAASMIKHDTTDPLILLNFINRYSFFSMYTIYSVRDLYNMSADMPVFLNMFTVLPLLRSFLPDMDEGILYYYFTEGFYGGLAIPPEIRAISYWDNVIFAFCDLSFMYGAMYFSLKYVLRILKYSDVAIMMFFPFVVMLDSMSVIGVIAQCVILSSIIMSFIFGGNFNSKVQSHNFRSNNE